ncbi:MAG: Tn3 family transposase [Aliidongia sp.]
MPPLTGEVPAEAEALKEELQPYFPLIDIPDLLSEVNERTGFVRCFTHLRTQDPARSTPAVMAAILADATNLGAKRMAGDVDRCQRASDRLGPPVPSSPRDL